LAQEYAWDIYLIRAKAQLLGRVHAPDRKSAVERAIKEFEITNSEQQKRLMAQRESSE
jgi:hypothetical protein